ncbi:HD domain protein [Bacteriovorax sp. BAL6_X]|uniref:HD domain-containing protein n=1 Tax=Bacteriovorax sp. BAL6_X TaxID=1201290 RepID=UPI0003864230|nr:HD domain-containing protein [Bacteriovorax sp. BAL6_X]EPZ49596.1 HD domain protein [Bacteriovorax sp. BAL6_X]
MFKKDLLDKIRSYYDHDDPSHDWSHVIRVTQLCEKLSQGYEVNLRVLIASAYLHDIINIPKNSEHRSKASTLAAQKAKSLLVESDYADNEIEHIAQIILEHSYSANLKASSIESEILQDADKLDAMGAIGVMRWASCGTKMKSKYYHLEDPWAKDRSLDDKSYSLDHFERKLLKLNDRLNTEAGKEEGRRRLDFFHSFLTQLKTEI